MRGSFLTFKAKLGAVVTLTLQTLTVPFKTIIFDSVPLCLLFSCESEDSSFCPKVMMKVKCVLIESLIGPKTW